MLANASIQNTTTLEGLPLCVAVDDIPAYVAASSCPHGWIPAFAGMTRGGAQESYPDFTWLPCQAHDKPTHVGDEG